MKCIVVVDKEWGIGKNNDLLFHLPYDMKNNFKPKTVGKKVVMGANTYLSFPRRPLSNRINIVLDDKARFFDGAITVNTFDKLKEELKTFDSDEIFVIGGASVYKLLLDYCDTALVTKVDAVGGAQVFFPCLDQMANWQLVEQSSPIDDNGYSITFNTYKNTQVKEL